MRILCIDDERSVYVSLCAILGAEKDTTLDFSDNLDEGFDKINTGVYDVAIIDLRFPKVKGEPETDCMDTIRKLHHVTEKVCVIVWTNHWDKENVFWVESIGAGAMNFLQKSEYMEHTLFLRHALLNSYLVFKERVAKNVPTKR
jgi:DNA-binding NtrC family response regulator